MATVQTNPTNDEVDEWTKPPFLRRVRIRGYKSIAFCDVELKPLTILVGRNAAGKSNFFDALAFLRDAVKYNPQEALMRHGGIQSIQHRPTPIDGFTIAIEVNFQTPSGSTYLVDYCLTVPGTKGRVGDPHRESLRFRNIKTNQVEGFEFSGGKLKWFGSDINLEIPSEPPGTGNRQTLQGAIVPGGSATINLEAISVPPGRLVLGMVGHALGVAFGEALASMNFYNFHPDTIRRLIKPQPGSLLDRDGSNLASVLDSLKKMEPDTVQRLREYLSLITEEVQNLDAVRYGEYETVRFHLRSASKDKPLEFDAASMSDGTLRALASLVAAFQIHLPSGPSVVGIEEPETALHPAASRALVAALDEATARTQILLTTHSADLLADRDIRPSQLLVVRNQNGQTQIAPVDLASREIIHKELYTLADLHRQDHLEPDWADLRRQENLARANGE
jgi:predicted ATPase